MAAHVEKFGYSDAEAHDPPSICEEVTTRVRVLCGRYQLDELIGRGGMGVVYRALDIQEGCECAVKLLTMSSLEAKQSLYRRFEREASVIANLSHPNIVEIRDFGYVEDGSPLLVMELLRGQDLYRVLQKQRRLPLPVVLEILRQVGSALFAMHNSGVLHRDIKPQNIFLCGSEGALKVPLSSPVGLVKLVDFGLSMPIGAEQLTAAGSVIGTLEYLAPEGTYGKSPALDTFSDQWSLAVMAYRMLCGHLPFSADNWINLALRIREARPIPLLEREPTLPPQVCVAIHRALCLQKAGRHPSIEEFVRALCAEPPAQSDIHLTLVNPDASGTPLAEQIAVTLPQQATPQVSSGVLGETCQGARQSMIRRALRWTVGGAPIVWALSFGIGHYLWTPKRPPAVKEYVSTLTAAGRARSDRAPLAPLPPFMRSVLPSPSAAPPPSVAPSPPVDRSPSPSSALPGQAANRTIWRHRKPLRPLALPNLGAPQEQTALALSALEPIEEEGELIDATASPIGHGPLPVLPKNLAAPSRSAPLAVPATATSRAVAASPIRRPASCGDEPRLPPEALQRLRGSRAVSGTYELCTDPQGKVSSARVVRGIPGADEKILSTLHAWRCPPWPVSFCGPIELEFILE